MTAGERQVRLRKLVIIVIWAAIVCAGLIVSAVAALIHWVCC